MPKIKQNSLPIQSENFSFPNFSNLLPVKPLLDINNLIDHFPASVKESQILKRISQIITEQFLSFSLPNIIIFRPVHGGFAIIMKRMATDKIDGAHNPMILGKLHLIMNTKALDSES